MNSLKRFAYLLILLPVGCGNTIVDPDPHFGGDMHDEHDDHLDVPDVEGIAVPSAVRDSLGITFVEVERRAISLTQRYPGQFELLPGARQEYRAPLAGRVELHVDQFEAVQLGDLILTLDSPEWRQMQHEAVEAEGEIAMALAAIDVARARRDEAGALLREYETRVQNLADVNVRKAELEAELVSIRASVPRLDAELKAQEAALGEAREHYQSRLNTLSSITGISIGDLMRENGETAAWRDITVLEIRAHRPGVVESFTVNDGGWLEVGALALTTVDPAAIQFHAEAPQSEIALLRDGQSARIVPAAGGSVPLDESIDGQLTVGLTAHEDTRTLSLYVKPERMPVWARAGVSAFLEVTVSGDERLSWSIPKSALVRDGLEYVFFRRNPENPDRVLRVAADLGESDGRWVALRSGVKAGDEVVLDGAYALNLVGSTQQAPDGYHYHADGTLHVNH